MEKQPKTFDHVVSGGGYESLRSEEQKGLYADYVYELDDILDTETSSDDVVSIDRHTKTKSKKPHHKIVKNRKYTIKKQPSEITVHDVKLDAMEVVTWFNKTKPGQNDANRSYLKTLINDSLVLYTVTHAAGNPPQSIVEQVLQLAGANDEGIYRSAIVALTTTLSGDNPLTNLSALHGLSYIILKNGGKYPLKNDEVNRLLDLILKRLRDDDPQTLEALNNLLDAMVASKRLVRSYDQKEDIIKMLKKNDRESKDPCVHYHSRRAVQAINRLATNESPLDEAKRRALALVSGIEAFVKFDAGLAGILDSVEITSLFEDINLVPTIVEGLVSFEEALNIKVMKKDWYDKVMSMQGLLAVTAIDPAFGGVKMEELGDLFTSLTASANDTSFETMWSLVDGLGKIVIMRNDAVVWQSLFVLEDYYKKCIEKTKTPKGLMLRQKQAYKGKYTALASKILYQLLLLQMNGSATQAALYSIQGQAFKELDHDFFDECYALARGQYKRVIHDPARVLTQLVCLSQKALNEAIGFSSNAHSNQPCDSSRSEVLIRPSVTDSYIVRRTNYIAEIYSANNIEDLKIIKELLTGRVQSILEEAMKEFKRPVNTPDAEMESCMAIIDEFFKNIEADLTTGTVKAEDSELNLLLKQLLARGFRFELSRPSRGKVVIVATACGGEKGNVERRELDNLKEGLNVLLHSLGILKALTLTEDADAEDYTLYVESNDITLLNMAADTLRGLGGEGIKNVTEKHPVFFQDPESDAYKEPDGQKVVNCALQ